MSLGRRIINTGAGDAVCNTESVQAFGADSTYSSNIALYQFEDNANDTTGNYNGTASNITYTTGKYGNAAGFNGSNSAIVVPNNILTTNDHSISLWFNLDDTDGIQTAIEFDFENRIIFRPVSSDSNKANIGSSGWFNHGLSFSTNQWYHLVITFSAGNPFKIYVDGVLSYTGSNSNINTQSNDNIIGAGNASGGNGLDGKIDQVRIFNKAISAEDVATLYAETTSTASNTNPFSEGAGLALYSMDYDASDAGGYYDGTPTDVEFGVEGQINYGARFNGSSSIIKDVLGSGFTYATKTMTFSAWIFVTDNSKDNVIIADGFTNATGGWAISTGYGSAPNQKLAFSRAGSVGGVQQTYGSVTIPDDTWTHIVVSVDFPNMTTNSSIKMYINGTEDTSLTDGIGYAFQENSTYNTSIGGIWFGSAGKFFEGSIDQVRIFNKALDSTEVGTLYLETACVHTATANTADYPSGTTTVAHYPLDNNTFDNKSTNDATYETNIEYRFGKYGQAAVFNGSSSQIITGYKPPATTTATISLWVNWKAYTNAYAVLAADNNTGTTANSFLTLATGGSGYGGNGYLWVSIGNGSSADTDTSIAFDDHGGLGNWIHVAVTVSGTSVNIYMNGYKAKTYTSTVSYAPSGSGYAYRLGYTSGWGYFDGKLDQVRFYSTELSSNQILELYNEKPEVDTSNFKAVLYEGDSNTSGNYISNVGFQPDLTWIKHRNANVRHLLTDSVNGVSVYQGTGVTLHSNETFTSTTYGEFTSFDANGFTVRFWSGSQYFNTTGRSYVAWNWKAGGDAVLNQNGGTNSQVSANPAAGFSIVKWTGDNSTTTIGHGLNSAPEVVIRKNLGGTSSWAFDTTVIDGSFDFLFLDTTAAKSNHTSLSAPTSTVFSTSGTSFNSSSMIAYCWHSVAGYSKIGSYAGTSASNNRIYTTDDGTSTGSGGFEPSWLMIKRTTGAGWYIIDNKRSTVSDKKDYLRADDNGNEGTSTTGITFNSDGFTFNGASFNLSPDTHIYMAFK